MTLKYGFCIVLLFSITLGETDEEKLRKQLLSDYDPMAFPPMPVQLTVGFTLINFKMNNEDDTMDTDLWLNMEWNDTRLSWNDTNIDVLHFRPSAVWRPDITLYNNADPRLMENYGNSHILISPNGKMVWIPPAHARSICNMDMTYWPHDTQICELKYGSWINHGDRLNVVLSPIKNFKVQALTGLSDTSTLGEWKLVSHNVTREGTWYTCCPEEYITIYLKLTLRRNSPAYGWTVQCPIAVLCLLTVVMFLLPPSKGEKIMFGSVVLFMNYYLLLKVSQLIGYCANHTPLIVCLLSKQLQITVSSVIVSAVILRITKSPHGRPLPASLKNLLTSVAPCLCLGGYSDMVNNSEDTELIASQDGSKRPKSTLNNSSWILLAAVVDRIGLLVFFIIFAIIMIQFSKVL